MAAWVRMWTYVLSLVARELLMALRKALLLPTFPSWTRLTFRLAFCAIFALAELVGFLLYAVVFPKVQALKQFRIPAQQQGVLTVKDDLAAAGLQTDHDEDISKPTRFTVAAWSS